MYGNMETNNYKIGSRIESFEELYNQCTEVGFTYFENCLVTKNFVLKYSVQDLELHVALGDFRKAVKIFNFFNFFNFSGFGKFGKIQYSEEEVRELFIKRAACFSTKHKHFGEILLKQDMDWFEENKKK